MPSENRNISDLTRSFLFQKGIIETVPSEQCLALFENLFLSRVFNMFTKKSPTSKQRVGGRGSLKIHNKNRK